MSKDSVDYAIERSVQNIVGGAAQLALVAGVLGLIYVWKRNQPTPEEKLLKLYDQPEANWGKRIAGQESCQSCSSTFVNIFDRCPYCDVSLISEEVTQSPIKQQQEVDAGINGASAVVFLVGAGLTLGAFAVAIELGVCTAVIFIIVMVIFASSKG